MEPTDLEALEESSLFAELPPEPRSALAGAARVRTFERKDFIFHQGEPAEHLFFVVSGRVKLSQTGADGQEVIVRFVGPGEILAGVALMAAALYPVTGTAAEVSRLLAWPGKEVIGLAEKHPALALFTTRTVTSRMGEMQERFRELATQRVAQRVARALLRLARQTGKRTAEGVELDLPLSRQDLAEMTGTTLYSVSRILSGWESDGLVATRRERVTLRRPHALVEIAEDLPEARS